MTKFIQKSWPIVSILLAIALLVSLSANSQLWGLIDALTVVVSLGSTIFLVFQKHIPSYRQSQTTRTKFTRNVLLDVLGLLLAIAAASYFGGMAGTWAGEKAGLWIGLLAGMVAGFTCAWGARTLWMRFTSVVAG